MLVRPQPSGETTSTAFLPLKDQPRVPTFHTHLVLICEHRPSMHPASLPIFLFFKDTVGTVVEANVYITRMAN